MQLHPIDKLRRTGGKPHTQPGTDQFGEAVEAEYSPIVVEGEERGRAIVLAVAIELQVVCLLYVFILVFLAPEYGFCCPPHHFGRSNHLQ